VRYLTLFITLCFCLLSPFLYGAESENKVSEGKTAEKKKIPPELQELIDRIKKLDEKEAFADMDRSIRMGNKRRLKVTLYIYPVLLNKQDTFGRTPLYNAVYAGQLELVSYLLNKHAKIATADVDGDTPLHRAAADGSLEILKLLLKRGAKYYVKNKKGRTPLFNAALHGEVESAKALITAGDKINRQDKYGDTPLHLAALKGKGEMVKFLLSQRADFTIKNKRGKVASELAKNAEVKKAFSH
jgi:ankyrin repeat protein